MQEAIYEIWVIIIFLNFVLFYFMSIYLGNKTPHRWKFVRSEGSLSVSTCLKTGMAMPLPECLTAKVGMTRLEGPPSHVQTACSQVPGACGMLLGRRWLLTRCWVTAHQMLPRVGGSSPMWCYRPLCQQPPSSTKASFHHSALFPSSCRRWFDDTTIRLSSVSRIHIEKDFLNDPKHY